MLYGRSSVITPEQPSWVVYTLVVMYGYLEFQSRGRARAQNIAKERYTSHRSRMVNGSWIESGRLAHLWFLWERIGVWLWLRKLI